MYAAGERGESEVDDDVSNDDIEQGLLRMQENEEDSKWNTSARTAFTSEIHDDEARSMEMWEIEIFDADLKQVPVDLRMLGWALAEPWRSIHKRLEDWAARDEDNKALMRELCSAMKKESNEHHLNNTESEEEEGEVNELINADEAAAPPAPKRSFQAPYYLADPYALGRRT